MSIAVEVHTHADATSYIAEWLNWLANELESGLAWEAEGCTIQNVGGRLVAKTPEGWEPEEDDTAPISMTIRDWRTAIDNARKAAGYIGSIQVVPEQVASA